MTEKRADTAPIHIQTTHQGQQYTGRYVLGAHMVTVTLDGGGSKTSQLGGTPTEALVNVLLLELIREQRRP